MSDVTCPKCGAPRTDRACPKCGLAPDKMDDFARKQEADVSGGVRAAWEALGEAWDSEERHAAFLRIVVDDNAFAWAASRYRDRLPDARAEGMLARVRKAAEARLVTSASPRPAGKTPFSSVKILLGGAVVMILALMFLLSYLRSKKPEDSRTLAPSTSAPQVR